MSHPINEIDMFVLASLFKQPLHGYALFKSEPFLDFKQPLNVSSVYHSLHKLDNWGYLLKTKRVATNAPKRQVYRLSIKGRLWLVQEITRRIVTVESQSSDLYNRYQELNSLKQVLSHFKRLLSVDNLSHKL